jgi:hypothetical protein
MLFTNLLEKEDGDVGRRGEKIRCTAELHTMYMLEVTKVVET